MRANLRELVDHALDVVDLAHDRVGALLEHRRILGDRLAVFAPQPLGRELDRRQRVLDLVRDAARDVGPGRGALRRHQLGDVVERDRHSRARRRGDCSVVTRTDRLRSRPCAVDRDLALHQPLDAELGVGEDLRRAPARSRRAAGRATSASSRPISCSAERLRMLMRPSASTPMTPALAPASTASVKRRRLSIRSRARTMSSRWVRSSCVILLKVSPSWARSPSERRIGTWT